MVFKNIKTERDFFRRFRCGPRAATANKRFPDKITSEDVLTVLKRSEFKCFYCSSALSEKKWQLDHFYPKAMGGLNVITNLVATCGWCNQMKNALDGYAFIHKCKLIAKENLIDKLNLTPL